MNSINTIRQFNLKGIVDNQSNQTVWRQNGQILKDFIKNNNFDGELIKITLPKGIYDVSKSDGNLVIDKSFLILEGATGNPEDVIIKSYYINNNGYCQNTIFIGATDITLKYLTVYNRTPIDTNASNQVKKTIEICQNNFTAIQCIFRGVDMESYLASNNGSTLDALKFGDCYYIDNSYRVDKTTPINNTQFLNCTIEFGKKVQGQRCGTVSERFSTLNKQVITIYNAISTVGWFNYDTVNALIDYGVAKFIDFGQVPIIKSYLDVPIENAFLMVVGDNIVYTNQELELYCQNIANSCTFIENGVQLTNADFDVQVISFLGRATIVDNAKQEVKFTKNDTRINGSTNIQVAVLVRRYTPEKKR